MGGVATSWTLGMASPSTSGRALSSVFQPLLHEGDLQAPAIAILADDLTVAKRLQCCVILRGRLCGRAPEAGDIGFFGLRLAFAVDKLA